MYQKNRKRILTVILAVLVLGMIYLFSRKEALPEERAVLLDSTEQTDAAGESEPQSFESVRICVFITGCVQSPGVYLVPEGSRIYEVLTLAGGFTEDADQRTVNLAEEVSDGQAIRIPAMGEDEVLTEASGDGRVNINTAGKEELMTLPGIGEAKAEAILSYREQHGKFSTAEALMEVSGIGEGVFSRLRDRIKV